jgi:hypothetical protein
MSKQQYDTKVGLMVIARAGLKLLLVFTIRARKHL